MQTKSHFVLPFNMNSKLAKQKIYQAIAIGQVFQYSKQLDGREKVINN